MQSQAIHVVIPCYRAAATVGNVIAAVVPMVERIYCVDDGCLEQSGRCVDERFADDDRVEVLYHPRNLGVGAAMVTGYKRAIADGARVIVKLDADGQMDPADIPRLVAPILNGTADYVKGNRFFNLEDLWGMPFKRKLGNAGLSFFAKLSTGYWSLFDPSNGFTAIHTSVAAVLPLDALNRGYFFEPDLLFRLNTLHAVVLDMPMKARYSDETSRLSEWDALFRFPFLHARNFVKRLFLNYFLRNFSLASLNLLIGVTLLTFGFTFGLFEWAMNSQREVFASAGTVMLAALPIIIGSQQTLNFIAYDMASTPMQPIHPRL